MKLSRDEVLMVPYKYIVVFGQIRPGAGPGQGQNWSRGSLLLESSPSDRKTTATNQMHSSDLEACGKKCCYFWFHSEVKIFDAFLTSFWTKSFCLILKQFQLRILMNFSGIYSGEGGGVH